MNDECAGRRSHLLNALPGGFIALNVRFFEKCLSTIFGRNIVLRMLNKLFSLKKFVHCPDFLYFCMVFSEKYRQLINYYKILSPIETLLLQFEN